MQHIPDCDLLDQFARNGSEEAFGELVRRHIGLVYSVAWRNTEDPHQAEEITQAVFIILARKAAVVGRKTILSGWLYHTARLTAANFRRSEFRRIRREQEAFMQLTPQEGTTDSAWKDVAPLLDEAIGRLSTTDRDAVVLRYFENKTLSEVGAALGVEERAAQKRVNRALEKLHRFFSTRGVNSTTAIIAETISGHSVQTVPLALAKSVTAVAITKGAAASAPTLTLIKGALKLMAWTKAKTAIIAGVIVLLAAGTTTMVVTKIQSTSLDAYLQDPDLDDVSNAPPMLAIQTTHFPDFNHNLGKTDGTREIGRNIPLSVAILKAYRFSSYSRMIYPEEVKRTKVDYLVTVPDYPYERFQAEIKRKFGWTAHVETRDADVFLLELNHPNAPGLTPPDNSSDEEWWAKFGQAPGIHRHNITASQFADLIEPLAGRPVIDRTGLTGKYDFTTGTFGSQQMNQVFLDQLGLEFVPSREPIEMLVVEKAN